MAKLTYKQRKRLHDSSFALPRERKYPLISLNHAMNALARVAAFGTSEEKRKVRAAVLKRFPSLKKSKKSRG